MLTKKFFLMHTILLFLLITITLLCFFGWLGLHKFEDRTSFKLGKEIRENWDKPMVTDVIISNTGACPSGYNALHEMEWPGTHATCSCPYQVGMGNYFNITKGECTATQLSTNCTTNIERAAVVFNLWKNSKVLCSKTGTTSFKEATENCKDSAATVCLDQESKVCVNAGEACPISYAKVGSAAEAGLSSLEIDTGVHLSFGSKTGNFPIASFHSSEENFCAFTSEQNLGSGNFIYKFLKKKDKKACLNDPNYLVVDSIGEEEYFKANNFYISALQIPGYPRPSNDNPYKIGARSSYKWDYTCRLSDDYNLGTATRELNLRDNSKVASIIAITTLVVLIVSGILAPGLHFVIYRYDLDGGKKNSMRNAIIFVDQVGKLAVLATVIMGVYFVWSSLNWFFDVIEKGCSDSFVKDTVLDDYVELFKIGAWLYTTSLILISIIVIHDLIMLTVMFRFSKKDKDAEKSKAERDLRNAKKEAAKKEALAKKKGAKKVPSVENKAQPESDITLTDVEAGNQNTDNALLTQQEEEIKEEKKDQDFIDHLKESIDKVGDKISGMFNFNKNSKPDGEIK